MELAGTITILGAVLLMVMSGMVMIGMIVKLLLTIMAHRKKGPWMRRKGNWV